MPLLLLFSHSLFRSSFLTFYFLFPFLALYVKRECAGNWICCILRALKSHLTGLFYGNCRVANDSKLLISV